MRYLNLFLVLVLGIHGTILAQETTIQLTVDHGSDNSEIQDMMRLQSIESCQFQFKGAALKGRDYTIILKHFVDGALHMTDTLVDTRRNTYTPKLERTEFANKLMFQQVKGQIHLYYKFPRFAINKTYAVADTKDSYALHSFLGDAQTLKLLPNTSQYIAGYFLPYLNKETGWKQYCAVSGSEHAPEDWGRVFDIPSYFLMEVRFD